MKKALKNIGLFAVVFLGILGCFLIYRFLAVRVEENRVNRQNSALLEQYQQGAAQEGSQPMADNGVRSRFAALYAQNSDLIGWLELGGGDFSAPVLQYTDNSYYLAHDFYGAQDVHGSIFLDYRNSVSPRDDNLVIYGHNRYAPNLNDTTMFYALTRFRKLEYLAANPLFSFDDLYSDGRYVIYAVFLADTDSSRGDVFEYHNSHDFSNDARKREFIEQVRLRSMFTSDVEVDEYDDLLMLSTCDYDFTGERLVVAARRLRDGEELSPAYAANPDAVMPDAWLELYGG